MTTITDVITDYLTTQSVHVLALFTAVLAITLLLRRRTAHLRYLLWLLIVAKCLVPPVHTIPLAVLPERQQSAIATQTEPQAPPAPSPAAAMPYTPPAVSPAADPDAPQPITTAQAPAAPTQTPPQSLNAAKSHLETIATWIPAAWLTGAVTYFLVIAAKGIRFNRYVRRHRTPITPATHPAWAGFLASATPKGKPLRIYQLDRPGQPFVWGLWRPAICLPSNFADVNDPHKQQSILMHETGHILRLDPVVNLLQVVAQGLFWFHPLVWAANRIIRTEREKCCDEFAVATLKAAPRSYCTAIVDALMAAGPARPAIPTLAVAGPVKNIEDRIKTLLTPGKRFYTRPTTAAMLTILLLAIVVVPTTVALSHRGQKPEVSNKKTSHDLTSKAAVCMNNGEYERARTLFKEALDLSPDFAEGWAGYGMTLIKLRDYPKGQKAYEKAFELHKRKYNDAPNANELIQQIYLLVLLNKNAEAEQLIQSGNQLYHNDDTFALFAGKDIHQLSEEWQEFRLPVEIVLTHEEKNGVVSEEDGICHLKDVVFQIIDDVTGQPLQNCEFNLCYFVYFRLEPGAPSPYLDKDAHWYITSFTTDIDGIFRLDLSDIYATDLVAIETREPYRHIRFLRSSDLARTESKNHIRVVEFDAETSQVVSNTIYDLKHKRKAKFPIFEQTEEKPFEKIVLIAKNPKQFQNTKTKSGPHKEVPAYRDAQTYEQMLTHLEAPQERWELYKDFMSKRGNPPAKKDYFLISRLINVQNIDDYLSLVCPESKVQLQTTPRGQERLAEIEHAIAHGQFPYEDVAHTKAVWLIQDFGNRALASIDFAIQPTHILTYLTYHKERKMLHGTASYLFKKDDTTRIVTEVLSELQSQRIQNMNNMQALADSLTVYAQDHESKLPETLEELRHYIEDEKVYQQLLDNVTYLGKGKTVNDPQETIIAVDKTVYGQTAQDESGYVMELLLFGEVRLRRRTDQNVPLHPGVKTNFEIAVEKPEGASQETEEAMAERVMQILAKRFPGQKLENLEFRPARTISAKLEFRMVPSLSPQQAGAIRFSDSVVDGYKWLPVRKEEDPEKEWPWYTGLPHRTIGDTVYGLVSDKPDETMAADGTWGLQKVYKTTDTMGRSVVGFDFDIDGAELFYRLTRRHIGKQLAMVIDGVVYSAPQINSAIRGKGIVNGHFDGAEVARLVTLLRNGMPPVTPLADNQQPGFTPVVEITVNDAVSVGTDSLIDFDTGTLFSMPETIHDPDKAEHFMDWFNEKGIDAAGATRQTARGLDCMDIIFVQMSNSFWEQMSALDMAGMNLWEIGQPGRPAAMTAQGPLPATYLFATREGGMGILQILGFTEQPRGVRIRYKMLQNPPPRPSVKTAL